MTAWVFYVLSALAAIYALFELPNLARIGDPMAPQFAWVRAVEMTAIAGACYFIGRWFQRRAAAQPRAAARARRAIPMGFVFPAVFLLVVMPIGAFVASGAGSHMSPLLLYPFASPWWLVDRESGGDAEIRMLLAGCGVNAVLLAFAGMIIDQRWRARRGDDSSGTA